ncbi:hemolysin family protein [Pacificimonas flava]|uniref:Magnesium and cobalt efflux protein CorC n=1 Tax=Pacificimonas flava TaxID=1234595 RepID=M2TM25_9SPHN|nr:hemolysin family protein [Pacificimonas flava]EMD82791.1 Magnesium and cobalt efflux protein CorC [Pacificimonas flava]MBB5279407.1 CBS domain containing-hemolysin-like protein [Pacificimonas flava]
MASQPDNQFRPLMRVMKTLLFGRGDASLRDAIEEALEEHEGDTEESSVAGDLSGAERLMLRNLLNFGERKAGDIMVPRGDIIAFAAGGSFPDLVAAFAEAGHSRMPVFSTELDRILGMIHVKDVYNVLAEEGRAADPSLESLLRPVLFVPYAMRVLDLLARMRAGRTHMAIVVDEYGGTDGLVTVEDIVEEIVGDIEDEHDEPEDEPIHALPGGRYEADARLDIEALEERLDTNFTEAVDGEIDTVGGLLFMIAGQVLPVGESIDHPAGWRFEVLAGDERRVERVRVIPVE